MNCPNCNTTLLMTEREGVEIDYCPNCRGVWLDKGELDKIIERSQNYFPSDSDDSSQRGYYPQNNQEHYQKRRKGFLGNLFDF